MRPLHVAAWSEGAAESIRLLLRAGAAPEATTPNGLSPAYLAAIAGRVDALELLAAAARRPPRWPAEKAPHPLLVAVERDDARMVAFLLRTGSDPNALRNELRRADGELAARITSSGGWLDLDKRRLRVPPEKLARALLALDRTEDFVSLESTVKAPA